MLGDLVIYLRDADYKDVDNILEWENNADNWHVSGTERAYTKEEINFLIFELQDIKRVNQTRQIICSDDPEITWGAVDLFEIDWDNKTAGIGILIANSENRNKGLGTRAIALMEDKARDKWGLNKLHCSIYNWNEASLRLFLKCGFNKVRESDGVIYMEKWLRK